MCRLLVGFVPWLLACSVLGQSRTWTTTDGRKAEGELFEVVGDEIGVRISGQEYRFPLSRFIPADRSFVQQWHHVSFLHWEVDPVRLAPYVPEGLELDTFEEKAYIGTIPFMMNGIRPRLAVSVPGISTFPEINIRTYVKQGGKAGVFFITLDAQSKVCLLYTSPRPRDATLSRMPSSA